MSTMIVTMTDEQLGALMREAVKTALREFTDEPTHPETVLRLRAFDDGAPCETGLEGVLMAKKKKKAPKSASQKLAEALEAEAKDACKRARAHLAEASFLIADGRDEDASTGAITEAVMSLGEARAFRSAAYDIRERDMLGDAS